MEKIYKVTVLVHEYFYQCSLNTFVLALNTTPAIVVPVFRGLGACPPSKRPSNAAFLERGREGDGGGGNI